MRFGDPHSPEADAKTSASISWKVNSNQVIIVTIKQQQHKKDKLVANLWTRESSDNYSEEKLETLLDKIVDFLM